MSIYLGLITATPEVERKIEQLHHLTLDEVRAVFQYPARPMRAWFEDVEPHGPRYLVLGARPAGGRILIAVDPMPWHAGGEADTWSLRTAFVE